MHRRSALLGILILTFAVQRGFAADATTKPASGTTEAQAVRAFNRGDYAIALPLLQKLATEAKDQPDQLARLQEQIRVCYRNLTPPTVTPPKADPTGSAPAVNAAEDPDHRVARVRPREGDAIELGIKELGNFRYDPTKGGTIPDDIKKLSGARIKTRGYMVPLDQAENITEFQLVPSLFACCFGQPPQIQHTLIVHTPKGKAVGYYPEEIIVDGTLKVDEKKDDGYTISLFEIDCNSVKPAPK